MPAVPTQAPPPVPTTTQGYSPVALCLDWPKLERLAIVIGLTFLGTLLNGFFVATFFVERTLQKLGNVYLACVGMADLIATSVVLPVVAVVLLSGQWDTFELCQALHFLIQTSTYCYSLFFTLTGMETFYRLCRTKESYQAFMSMGVVFVSVMVFVISFVLAGIGVYMRQDYDYCGRRYYGNFYFKVTTSILCHGIPLSVTLLCLFIAVLKIKRRAKKKITYRRSQQFDTDYTLSVIHICILLIYVLAWLPYMIVMNGYPSASDGAFYGTAWLGLVRATCSSCVYSIASRSFRRAFAQLFNYCCCKNSLSEPMVRRRRPVQRRLCKDLNVHLMQRAAAQQRAALMARHAQLSQYQWRQL